MARPGRGGRPKGARGTLPTHGVAIRTLIFVKRTRSRVDDLGAITTKWCAEYPCACDSGTALRDRGTHYALYGFAPDPCLYRWQRGYAMRKEYASCRLRPSKRGAFPFLASLRETADCRYLSSIRCSLLSTVPRLFTFECVFFVFQVEAFGRPRTVQRNTFTMCNVPVSPYF